MDWRSRHLPAFPEREARPSRPCPAAERETPAAPPLEPGASIGDFSLVREISRAATGTVYAAQQSSHDRLVALKVLDPKLASSPKAVRRFHAEAALAARIRDPGILPVLSAGSRDGQEFYATALPAGPSLTEFLEGALGQRGEIFFRDAALYFAGLARTVDALHRAGIIHRRISPQSIFLEADRLVLTDFELAIEGAGAPRPDELLELERTVESSLYFAPEEFVQQSELGPPTDLYSLGLCLYELATGVLPFPRCRLEDLARLKLTREPIAPRRLNPDIPLGLEAVIRQAIESAPALRHSSAEDLARDLERVAAQKRGATRRHACRPGPVEEDGGDSLSDLARIA